MGGWTCTRSRRTWMRRLHSRKKTPLVCHSLTSSTRAAYALETCMHSLLLRPALLPVAGPIVSTNTSEAWATMSPTSSLTTSLLRSVEGACRKFSLM